MHKISYKQLVVFSAIISLLLSFSALWTQAPVNPDTILYIKTAQVYLQDGFAAASAVYNWPFFSIIGAYVSSFTGLSFFHAFHVVNMFFQLLIVVGFIQLIKNLGANERVLVWAALVVLIFPTLNNVRDYITRDFAYCACALYAVLFLLKYLQFGRWRDAILWAVLILFAGCFRLEGLAFLLTLPIACLCCAKITWSIRLQNFLRVFIISLVAGLLAFALFYLHPHTDVDAAHQAAASSLHSSVPVNAVASKMPGVSIFHKLQQDALLLRQAILDGLSKNSALTILLGGLVAVIVAGIVGAVKPLYLLLAYFGQKQKLIANDYGEMSLLVWGMIINLIVFAGFVLKYYFFEVRYSLFMALLWMTWVPFALEKIFQTQRQKHPVLWLVICIWLLEMAISGVGHFGVSKAYITKSGQWLAQHMQADQTLFSNSMQISFYATDHQANQDRLEHLTEGTFDELLAKPAKYDWIAIRINGDDHLTPAAQKFVQTHQPVVVFDNKRHDRVMIYSGFNTVA